MRFLCDNWACLDAGTSGIWTETVLFAWAVKESGVYTWYIYTSTITVHGWCDVVSRWTWLVANNITRMTIHWCWRLTRRGTSRCDISFCCHTTDVASHSISNNCSVFHFSEYTDCIFVGVGIKQLDWLKWQMKITQAHWWWHMSVWLLVSDVLFPMYCHMLVWNCDFL